VYKSYLVKTILDEWTVETIAAPTWEPDLIVIDLFERREICRSALLKQGVRL
jgi:hypothetical protein